MLGVDWNQVWTDGRLAAIPVLLSSQHTRTLFSCSCLDCGKRSGICRLSSMAHPDLMFRLLRSYQEQLCGGQGSRLELADASWFSQLQSRYILGSQFVWRGQQHARVASHMPSRLI